jgi:hypothetical protein
MRIRSWTAALAIAIALTAAPAASAETATFSEPFAAEVPNECTGDVFSAVGTVHMKLTSSITLTGLKSQVEMNLTGVQGTTLTGVRYVMNSQTSDMSHADFDPDGDAQQTTEQTLIMNRQGETGALLTGDDFQLHVITHLTVTNGVAKATKFDVRGDCR